jgi:uncharacterized damage-inducible protein DinB
MPIWECVKPHRNCFFALESIIPSGAGNVTGRVIGRPPKVDSKLGTSVVKVFAANERANQLLLEHLDPAVWRAAPPGKVRSIAAIFSHMHNVRTKWIRLNAPHLKVPAQLNRASVTPQQVSKAFAASAARCEAMLVEASSGRVKKFVPDSWFSPLPAGPEMLAYMVAHEAHHRGQIAMLAHQLGFPLTAKVTASIWNWEKLRKPAASRTR